VAAESKVILKVDARNATRALNGVQNQTTRLQKSFSGLKASIAGLGIGLIARQAVNTSANFEKLNVRLGLLTKSSGTFAKSQQNAADAQKAFGLSATEALEGITDITARLAPLGVGVDDIKSTFFGFNTAAKLAGASTIEASNAFRQLAQALGSGRLQGDEFRSISEQIPTLLGPIADELGVTVGQLKKFASEGKLTSAVVLRALKKIETEGSASLKELVANDPTQIFKNLSNATEDLSRSIGEKLRPAVEPTVKALTDLTVALTNFINSTEGQTALILAGITLAIKGLGVVIPLAVAGLKSLAAGFSLIGFQSIIAQTGLTGVNAASLLAANGINKLAFSMGALSVASKALPLVAIAGGFAFLTNSIIKALNKQREFNELLEKGSAAEIENEIEKVTAEIDKLNTKIKEITKDQKGFVLISGAEGEEAKVQKLKNDLDKLNETLKTARAKELANDFIKTKSALQQTNIQLKDSVKRAGLVTEKQKEQFDIEKQRQEFVERFGVAEADKLIKIIEQNNELKKQEEQIKKNAEATEGLKEKFKAIGDEIESSIKNNLRDAITGAKSFGEAMSGVLNRIRDKIIDAQIDRLIGGFGDAFSAGASGGKKKGLGGFLGGLIGGLFANGGQPPVNKISVVGERGPELFVPSTKGTIIPNNQLGGGGGNTTNNMITVNVDASGTSVQGNGSDADQLGALIAGVVQATIIDEQRSGGLLDK